MPTRFSDVYIYALDENLGGFCLYEEHTRNNGFSKSLISIGDKVYDSTRFTEDEEIDDDGESATLYAREGLPFVSEEDLLSYFSENPSNNVLKALEICGKSNVKVIAFFAVLMSGVGEWITEICHHMVTAEMLTEKKEDL